MFASIALFAGVAYAAPAPTDPSSISCLEADRGYQLIKQDGSIDVVRLYSHAVKKFGDSSLNRQTQSGLQQFGVTTGDPREWARLFVMVCKQESGCRIARTYADGSLERFRSTLPTENSFGPFQFNKGEYGLTSWAMVNSPSCTLEAFIRVAERRLLFRYFGSMQRPHETLRHAGWFNTTVQPFTDALTLTFDPNAPDMRTYQAVAPYFVSPEYAMLYGQGAGNGSTQGLLHPSLSQLMSGQSSYNPTTGLLSGVGSSPFSLGNGVTGSVSQPGSSQPSQGGSGGNQPGTGTSAPQSALKIIAQPGTVRVGQQTYVSWTSAGMQANSCSVRKNGADFASGNQGSLRDTATGSGTMMYTLTCSRLSGGVAESSATVSIQ